MFVILEGGYNIDEMFCCLFNFLVGMNGFDKFYYEEEMFFGMCVWEIFEIYVYVVMGNLCFYWKF